MYERAVGEQYIAQDIINIMTDNRLCEPEVSPLPNGNIFEMEKDRR